MPTSPSSSSLTAVLCEHHIRKDHSHSVLKGTIREASPTPSSLPEACSLAWPQPVTQHFIPTLKLKLCSGRQMGCTYLLKVTGVSRQRRATSLLMKFRPQYLGCIMMSPTGIFRAREEPLGWSVLLPNITEYSLLLWGGQEPTW